MRDTAKRMLSLFLCIVMLVSLMPTAVFAEEYDAEEVTAEAVEEDEAYEPAETGEEAEALPEEPDDTDDVRIAEEDTAEADIFSDDGVILNEKNFPDANFRAYLCEKLSIGEGDALTSEMIASVTGIYVSGHEISSLKGIEYFTALESLDCSGNALTELDVSGNTKLQELFCYENALTALNVGGNTELQTLNCGSNALTSLDLSGCTGLEYLDCGSNALTELNVSGNTELQTLECGSNALTALDVSGNTKLESLYCVGSKLTTLDVSGNAALQALYCGKNALTELDVSGSTKLETLDCGSNKLTRLNVSGCTGLSSLDCSNNALTELDVSGDTVLKTLSCHFNALTALNVSGCTALDALYCNFNALTSLDLSSCTALEYLLCLNNKLTELDVSGNTGLKTLFCNNNALTELDVSGNTELQSLVCNDNALTTLDLSGNTELICLSSYHNRIATGPDLSATAIPDEDVYTYSEYQAACEAGTWGDPDVYAIVDSKSIRLNAENFPDAGFRAYLCEELDIGEGDTLTAEMIASVTTIDVSKREISSLKGIEYFTALEYLDCYGNALTELDLSGNPVLRDLYCYENALTELDVSGNTALVDLDCSGNKLTTLNVKGCADLKYLKCYDNALTTLDVSGCTALTDLDCSINKLTKLNVSGNTALETLYCYENGLTKLNVSGNTALKEMDCSDNALTELDLSGNTALKWLCCYHNDLEKPDLSATRILDEDVYTYSEYQAAREAGTWDDPDICAIIDDPVYGNITVGMEQTYLALQVGESKKVKVSVDPESLSSLVVLSTENADSGESVISVENDTVTALKPGTAYVVAALTYNGSTFSARCRVDVTEEPAVPISVGLTQTSFTSKLYSTDYAEIPVILNLAQNASVMDDSEELGGKAIESAEFDETFKNGSDAAKAFTLQIKDDRTLQLVPTEAALNGSLKLLKTYNVQLRVKVTGQEEAFTTAAIKISVNSSTPKLKAGSVKFNAFDVGNTQALNISGAVVTGLSLDSKYAAPAGIELDAENMCLVLSAENPPTAYKSGKLYLQAELEGWSGSWPITVSYGYSNKDLSLKLKSGTLTVLSGSADAAFTTYTVSPNEFADFDKYPITVASITDTTAKKTVENGTALTVCVYDGAIVAFASEASTYSKTNSYKVTFAANGKTLKTALTVKVLPAATAVTVSAKAAGAIDTAIPNSPITLTVSMKNFNVNSGETYQVRVEQYKAKTKTEAAVSTDVTDRFCIAAEGNVITLTQKEGSELPGGCTYNAYVSVDVTGDGAADYTAKAVKLSVKWSDPSKVLPSVTLKASGSIDPIRAESAITLTPTIKNWYGYELQPTDLTFYRTVGKTNEVLTDSPFTVTVENGRYILTAKSADAVKASEKYSVSFNVDLNKDGKPDFNTAKPTSLSVKMGSAKFTQSTKAVSLIKSDRYDSGTVVITPQAGLNRIADVKLDDASAVFYELQELGDGTYAICFAGHQVNAKAKTVTARISVRLEGNNTDKANGTVSVKVNLVTAK